MFPAKDQWRAFGFEPQPGKVSPGVEYPFDHPAIVLRGRMIRTHDRQAVTVELVPLGNAPILRRTTHPLFS